MLPFLSTKAQTNPDLDHVPNPGNTGAYAFSFIDHATDASIGDNIIIDLKVDAGKDKLGSVQGGIFRLKIPFAHWVELEADFVSDRWKINDETKDRFGINGNTGTFDGDLTFKTKVKIFSDSKNSMRPALAFQATAKTAAGDFKSTHRYTDSAGYEFAILGSKVLMESDDAIIRKVKFLSELAFVAWDTGVAEQNDAFKASTGIQVESDKLKMRVSYLGFYGWQNPNLDHVSSLQLEASTNLRGNFQAYGQVNLGLSKAATPYMVGGGVRYYIAAPKKKRRVIPIDQ